VFPFLPPPSLPFSVPFSLSPSLPPSLLPPSLPLSFFPSPQTTPGDCLEEGQLLAARLCTLWGHKLLATKYALEAAYDIMKVSEGHLERILWQLQMNMAIDHAFLIRKLGDT